MSALSRRLSKLEGTNGTEDLVVILSRFSGTGEYTSVKCPTGQTIELLPNEDEKTFLARASDEIVTVTKKEKGPQPCYVMQPLRRGESALKTTPQPCPTVTRDEWLIAHGLNPISGKSVK